MILVIAEQRSGTLNRASWEAIAGAQQLAAGQPVHVAVIGASVGAVAAELASAAVAGVITVEQPALEPYTPDGYTAALAALIGQLNPSCVVLSHTYQTRDFAPKLAARLDRAIVTDCTGFKPGASGTSFTRSMFQGKLTADVMLEGPTPHFITFQIGAFRVDAVQKGSAPASVSAAQVTVDAGAVRQKPDEPFQEARQAVDLSQAERIVAVGRGIKAAEHLELAKKLAAALGAELAASRPICDNGWLPMERQIGSSGQTVSPKLYMALGISGAIQHVVGMKGSRTIVAINKDAEAPIFDVADYGIVGDLFDIVPAIIAEVEKG
jgi:electron transfer flavoprotein alpha subunit